jgi:hypothetical protein
MEEGERGVHEGQYTERGAVAGHGQPRRSHIYDVCAHTMYVPTPENRGAKGEKGAEGVAPVINPRVGQGTSWARVGVPVPAAPPPPGPLLLWTHPFFNIRIPDRFLDCRQKHQKTR